MPRRAGEIPVVPRLAQGEKGYAQVGLYQQFLRQALDLDRLIGAILPHLSLFVDVLVHFLLPIVSQLPGGQGKFGQYKNFPAGSFCPGGQGKFAGIMLQHNSSRPGERVKLTKTYSL